MCIRDRHLTQTQFEVLFGLLKDTVNDIEEDIVSDTVTYQIYQKLNQMEGNK